MRPYAIITAESPEHYAHARTLFEDYQRWLGIDLCFQNFSEELERIGIIYGPPSGALLLAQNGADYVGCVGIRALDKHLAEMKRMFIPEAFRGRGIGKALAAAAVSSARTLGYSAVRLDTVPRLDVALSIYRKLGFVEIPPYRHNPDSEALFLELKL